MWGLVNLKCAHRLLPRFVFFLTLFNQLLHRRDESCGETWFCSDSVGGDTSEVFQHIWSSLSACCSTHTHASSISLVTFGSPGTDRRAVLAAQMFFCLWWACLSSQQALSTYSGGRHTAVTLFFYRPSGWPWGPQVKSCLTFGRIIGVLWSGFCFIKQWKFCTA